MMLDAGQLQRLQANEVVVG